MLCVAVIQHAVPTAHKQDNLTLTSREVRKAAAQGAQLILLQELHCTHYFCQTQDHTFFDLAEPLDGPSRHYLQALAQELKIVLVGSIFEKRAAGVFHNTALVFDGDKGLVGLYRKMHIPDDPGFYEKYYFTPGDSTQKAFAPIQTSVGRLGVLICWDQWYPEAARLAALQGAEILLYPTAIGWDPLDTQEQQTKQQDAWQLIQRSHAIANHLPVLVANRTGFEPSPNANASGIEFWGQSFICGQQGDIIAIAEADFTGSLVAPINLSQTESLRRIWPYLRDRRIDAYTGLLERYID